MMDSSDGISLFLEQLALKKNSLRKAILMLALESKDLNEHLDSTKECCNECVNDLQSKRKMLESNRDSIVESSRELVVAREMLESRMKEIKFREEEFRCFQKTQLEEIKIKEEQLAEIRKTVVGKMEEVMLKEERLNEQTKLMDMVIKKFHVEKQEFEDIQRSVGEKLNVIRLEKRKIEDYSKEFDVVHDRIERRTKELSSKEEKVEMREQQLRIMETSNEERCRKLDIVAQELGSAKKLIEDRSKQLDLKENQLNSLQNYIQKSFDDFHARSRQLKIVELLLEKQLEDQSKSFKSLTKQLEEQFTDFELKKKQLEEWCEDLELKEMRVQEWVKYFELKQTQLTESCKVSESKGKKIEENSKEIVLEGNQLGNVVDSHVEVVHVEDIPVLVMPSEIVIVDGKSLQLYLNEHFENYGSSSKQVCHFLRLLPDPAKLVLDAIEGFYPPHLMKEDVEFETSVVRRSCILLLEQLMRLSLQICPDEKKRALTLASTWRVKLEVFPRNPSEVLAFILLLASYNLASNFNTDEVLQLMKFVPLRNQVPDLCRFLSLQEKVSDFIRRLIERRLHLEAVEYVCVFNVSDEFPPVPLLDVFISYEKEAAGKVLEEGLYSIQARDTACQKELYALKALLNCVTLHELESQYPVGNIRARIEQLESRRILLPTLSSYSFPKEVEERHTKKHKALIVEHGTHSSYLHSFPKERVEERDTKKHKALIAEHGTHSSYLHHGHHHI